MQALDQIQAYLSQEMEEVRLRLNPTFSPPLPSQEEIAVSASILARELHNMG